MRHIPERDWKKLRAMKTEVLEEVCAIALEEVRAKIDSESESLHKTYLSLFKILRKHDKKVSEMFDDLKRSNAKQKLGAWRRYGFLSDEELSKFSEETRTSIEFLASL